MELTTEQWLIIGSYIMAGITLLFNFGEKIWNKYSNKKIEESKVKLDEGELKVKEITFQNLLNENARLSSERALKSEKDLSDAENRFDERGARLTKRIDDLESKLNLAIQENITLKSEMAEMHMKQAMSDKLIEEQRLENESLNIRMKEMVAKQTSSDKLIEEQRMAQTVSQRLIEEQRREIIALQDFSERLIAQVVGHDDTPVQYKPDK